VQTKQGGQTETERTLVGDIGELYGSLNGKLTYIVARKVNAPRAVIDDACQFAWTRLVIHARRVDRETVVGWLVSTATREGLKQARRALRDVSLERELDEEGELSVAAREPGPDELAEWRARLDLVRALPVRQQRVLWLKAMGYSYEEIAARELGLTERTVERQIQRGRRALTAAA
jgi:RNA polymerase sigma-70 factor (ECF subfamily)